MSQAALKMKIPAAPTWDLESIFPGGSKSERFTNFRDATHKKIDTAKKLFKALSPKISKQSINEYVKFIGLLQEMYDDIELVLSLSNCVIS